MIWSATRKKNYLLKKTDLDNLKKQCTNLEKVGAALFTFQNGRFALIREDTFRFTKL
jgi:hypothetical protein